MPDSTTTPAVAGAKPAKTHAPLPRLTFRIPEVAAQLGVAESTVYRWAASGTLTTVRVNGVVLVKPADLEAFLDEHREGHGLAPQRNRSTRMPRAEGAA